MCVKLGLLYHKTDAACGCRERGYSGQHLDLCKWKLRDMKTIP